jgi:small subunit ribosomal protein S5
MSDNDNTNLPESTPGEPDMTPPQDAMPGTAQQTGEPRNDGSDPMPHRGELAQHAAGAADPGPTADGRQTAAGTADDVVTPDQVLSNVELKPAASVGPVVPGRGRGRGGRDSRGGRGDRRGRGGRDEPDESGIESSVIRIYRCSKVVKGGRTFSFAALVVTGDRNGQIGFGYGKANEVPSAVEKATKEARKTMFTFPMKGSTIPHMIIGKSGSSQVKLIPALPGTGVTAGKTVRPVLELAGLTDVLTKAYGSTSPKNLLKATIDALRRLQSREQVASRRGVTLEAGAGELASTAAE